MLAARLDGIAPTIFNTMSALAVRTGSVNLGQGFPDEDGPASMLEAAQAAIDAGHNQYAPGIGVPPLRQAIARHQQRHYGIDLDPDTPGRGHDRVHRGGRRRAARAGRPGRRGGRAGAVLRLLRRDDPDGRRRTTPGDAPLPRLPPRRRRAAGGGDAADPVRAAQHPAQPDRHGADRRGAAGGRRRRDRARPGRDHRRGLRAPGLRRPPAPADRHAAGDVGPHADAVERRQVVVGHRLEGRLGDRAGRAGGRGDGGQAVAHLHLRHPGPSTPSPTPSTRRRTSRPRWPGRCRTTATCSAAGSPTSASRRGCRRAPTSR